MSGDHGDCSYSEVQADRFSPLFACLFRRTMDNANQEEIDELLSKLSKYSSFKLKSKYVNFVVDTAKDTIESMVKEEMFAKKLALLNELSLKTSSDSSIWRPSEVEFNEKDLFRNHRIKFLKKQIKVVKNKLHLEEVKGHLFKEKLNKFLTTFEEIERITKNNKKEMDAVCNALECASLASNVELQEFLQLAKDTDDY